MAPDPKKARKTIKLKPLSKTPGSSAESKAPADTGAGVFGEAPTVKFQQPKATAKPDISSPPPVQPSSENATNGEHTGTQPLKKMPSQATRPGSLIPGVKEDFSAGTPATDPSAVTQVRPAPPKDNASPKDTAPSIPPREEIQDDDAPTQKLGTAKKLPKPQQTIKLRPSTTVGTPAPSADTTAAGPTVKLGGGTAGASTNKGGQTIKLTPVAQKESAPAKPSSPTVKLTGGTTSQEAPVAGTPPKPGAPTVKLTATQSSQPQRPGSPTVKLTPGAEQAPPSGVEPEAGGEPQKTRLTLKKQEAGVESEMQEGQLSPDGVPMTAKDASAKNEPSIIFTLAALVTLVAMGYFCYMSVMQYKDLWL